MGFYLAYRYVLPVITSSVVLILFFVTRKEQKHKGWWVAFLFFGLSVAILLPMKGNPFEARKQAHEQSVHTLEQLDALTVGNGWFSQPELAENVTDKIIQSAEKQLPLVEKRKQKKAKEQLQLAWDCWNVHQAELFFSEHLGWHMGSFFNYPEKETIQPDSFQEAHKLLSKINAHDKKAPLETYLADCEKLVGST